MTAIKILAAGLVALACAQAAVSETNAFSLHAPTAPAAGSAPNGQFDPYDYAYCLACHGSVGQGNPALRAPVLAGMEDWYLRNQLRAFRAGWRGTHPADLVGMEMRAVATALEPKELDAAIDYITALPVQVTAGAEDSPPAQGASLYRSCAACHGERAEGNAALQAPALWYQQDAYLLRQLRHYRDAIRGSAPGDTRGAMMQAAARGLEDAELTTLVAYICSLRPEA